MKRLPFIAVGISFFFALLWNGSASSVTVPGVLTENGGSSTGFATTINCSTGMSCSNSKGVFSMTATGGGSGITALTQDVSASGSGSVAATVQGVNTVPLCSGFSPTNGQFFEYTTGGSPSPCWSSASGGGGGGGSSVNIVQAGGCRGNPVTTCAMGQPVASASDVCMVALGWTAGASGNPTATDSVGTTYALKLSFVTVSSSVSSIAVLAGTCGATGSNTVTVTWPSSATFEGIHPIEAKGISTTTDGTASGTIASNTLVLMSSIASITTSTAGDLVIMALDGQNSTPGTDIFCYGATVAVAASQGADSGGVCSIIQNAAGAIANGAYNNSTSGYSVGIVAFKHS
jgi:hypothetical protein